MTTAKFIFFIFSVDNKERLEGTWSSDDCNLHTCALPVSPPSQLPTENDLAAAVGRCLTVRYHQTLKNLHFLWTSVWVRTHKFFIFFLTCPFFNYLFFGLYSCLVRFSYILPDKMLSPRASNSFIGAPPKKNFNPKRKKKSARNQHKCWRCRLQSGARSRAKIFLWPSGVTHICIIFNSF